MRAALLLFALLATACVGSDLAFPSPDGKHVAWVRNHWALDPPSQSLWIDDRKIVQLGEDQDWCNAIAWSPNGALAGFLVQDAKLITVNVATRRIVEQRWLVDRDGYPTSQAVCNLRLDNQGRPEFTAIARHLRPD